MPTLQSNMASPKIRWTKVNDSGLIPRPRHGHRAVSVRELMIIFGGGNEGIVDELHAYNTVSNQWFCPVVKGDVPPGAAAFGLAADNTRLLFHGGMIEYGMYSDALYELQVGPYFATGNISSKWEWKKLKPKAPRFAQAPAARLGHSFTCVNGKFYVFGGLCRDIDPNEGDKGGLDIRYSNDLYVLDFRSQGCFWEMPHTYGPAPSPRESHTAVSHVDSLGNPKLVIYGGMAGIRLGDINILDLNSMTWSQPEVDGPKPLPRSLHSSSVVGDKMYVFGGWVPVDDDDDNYSYEQKWECTNSLARLNLNTYKWEEIELDCPDGSPQPRAGHSAVVVGSRIYIWSGRDGYSRIWDVQVCCKDLWFLEVGKPGPAGKVHLVKAGTRMLELTLPEVAFCDHYILQTMPYSVPLSPKTPETAVPKKKKRKVPETDWADDDVGPMLPPTSPLPEVPAPPAKAEKALPPISICEDPLPSFLLPPPKPTVPPIYTIPSTKPLQRLPPPPMVQTTTTHPQQRFIPRPLNLLPPTSQHQPLVQQNVVRSSVPPPPVQYVSVHEFARHFPNPDPDVNMRIKAPGMVITKPFNPPISQSEPKYPNTIELTPMTPVPMKAIPQRATVVKVVNPSLGTFSNMRVQPPPPPQVFTAHNQQVPPPKHTIIINKPVNKLPGQQIVVVSSASVHRSPQPYQTIQTFARPEANYFLPQKQMKFAPGNGIKTFPVHTRLPPPAPARVQVQNPMPMYKNVKLQVNGKTLTVMMPISSASAPVTSTQNNAVYQTAPQQSVLTNSCKPKFAIRQEPALVNPPKPEITVAQIEKTQNIASVESEFHKVKAPSDETDSSNAEKTQASQPIKISVPTADVASNVIRQPKPSCSGILIPAGSKPVEDAKPSKPELDQVLELPDPPSNIKISKVTDGAVISWTPPSKGIPATGYSVNLGIKADEGNPNKITFITVYSDVHTKTKIPQEVLDRATLSFPKPTIIFRVSARNELGYGPATQVRWLQDPKNDTSAQSDNT